jgi:Xaa-Pro aminopeptidase
MQSATPHRSAKPGFTTQAPAANTDNLRLARNTAGMQMSDSESPIDMARLRQYRLARVRAQLASRDYGACVLFDPINIRYATGTRNMQVWTQHSPDRYAFVPADGPVILFDGYAMGRATSVPETVGEVRPPDTWYFEAKADRLDEAAATWASGIDALMRQYCGANRRLAVDRFWPVGIAPCQRLCIDLVDAQAPLERARSIKSADEIACMSAAISVCEGGIARMREALRLGMTENALWSLLVQANAEHGGEWMETRLLASGGRTNPWYQECCDKVIRAGELVAFDTDLVGPFGYCVDISRTFHCGPGRPTGEQRNLYRLAYEQVQYNIDLIRPGMEFREFAEKSWPVPDAYLANRYVCLAHGVGLVDEYPDIVHPLDWATSGYDGVFEENMAICVESYIGRTDGVEGVKLEEQILLTGNGTQILSTFPYEESLLS